MYRHSLLVSVVVVLLLSNSALSQETNAAKPVDDTAATLRKKAIALLESVASQTDSLRSAENRARIGSNAAALLWSHDEKRARVLFQSVAEDIKTGFNETTSNEEAQTHKFLVFSKLRSDTIERIAPHDPELALEFLLATKFQPDARSMSYVGLDREKTLEVRLAGLIAAKNPQLSLKLARQSLANGFSPELLSLLVRLDLGDKEAGRSLYREIFDKLKNTNPGRNSTATQLAIGLATEFQPPEVDVVVYRELLGVVLKAAMADGCGDSNNYAPSICYATASLFPKLEEYFGSQAAPLRRFRSNEDYQPPPARVTFVLQNGTIEEMLALIPKYPELQDGIYWSAMEKARASGDMGKAREVAANHPDQQKRGYLVQELDRNQRSEPFDAAELTQIQREISSLPNPQKVQSLMYRATQISVSDRKGALALLNQAGEIIDTMRPLKTQLTAQVRLALLYCSLKSDRGMAIMETLMPRLNELVSAAALLDEVENNYLRDGEWNMTAEGVVGSLLTVLAQNAGTFAGFDFDRSLTLTRQFVRPELRLMGELKLAQGILGNPRKTFSLSESAPAFDR